MGNSQASTRSVSIVNENIKYEEKQNINITQVPEPEMVLNVNGSGEIDVAKMIDKLEAEFDENIKSIEPALEPFKKFIEREKLQPKQSSQEKTLIECLNNKHDILQCSNEAQTFIQFAEKMSKPQVEQLP